MQSPPKVLKPCGQSVEPLAMLMLKTFRLRLLYSLALDPSVAYKRLAYTQKTQWSVGKVPRNRIQANSRNCKVPYNDKLTNQIHFSCHIEEP